MCTTVVGLREVHGRSKQVARAILALGVEACIEVASSLIAEETIPTGSFGEGIKVSDEVGIGFGLCA